MIEISKKPITWFTSINEIEANGYEYNAEHFLIIENIDLCKVISSLSCGNKEEFENKSIWPFRFTKDKIDSLERAIKAGNKILPPSIIFIDGGIKLNDGRHRIRIALEQNQQNISILISKGYVK